MIGPTLVNSHADPVGPSEESPPLLGTIPIDDLLQMLLKRPIAFHRIFAEIAGGALPGLFLSQAWYWSSRTSDPDGWFFKTQQEWEEETALDRYEQERARKILRTKGIIEEVRRGIPAKLYFRLCKKTLHTSMRKSAYKRAEIRIQESGNPQSIPETSSETSSEKETPPIVPRSGDVPAQTLPECIEEKSRINSNHSHSKPSGKPRALSTNYTTGFLQCWALYPPQRRVNKTACFAVWQRNALEPRVDEIAGKLTRLLETTWQHAEVRYIPLTSTWFNSARWEDDIVPLPSMPVLASPQHGVAPSPPIDLEAQACKDRQRALAQIERDERLTGRRPHPATGEHHAS